MAIIRPGVAGFPGVSRQSLNPPKHLTIDAGKLIVPPTAPVGGGGSDVARAFSAAGSNKVAFSSGAFAGATFDYGTIAFVTSFTADAGNWQDVVSLRSASGTGESGCIEVSPGSPGNLWFANQDLTGTYGPLLATGNYFIAITKATGSVIPVWHIYNYGTSAWTHANSTVAAANGTSNITSIVVGEYPGGFDYQNSKLSTVGVYRHWNPSNAALEAANLHLDLDNWVTALTNADLAWLVAFNQASTATTVLDLSTGGGNQTAITGTTVSTGPAAYDNSISAGGGDTTATVPAVLASPSTFFAPTIDASGNATSALLSSSSTFPSATARASGVASPATLASPSAFNAPTVSATGTPAAGLLTSTSSFPTPSVQASGVAVPALLSSPSSFGQATGVQVVFAPAPALASPSSFGTATASASGAGSPVRLDSPSTFGSATVGASGTAPSGLLLSPSAFPVPTARATGVAAPTTLQSPSTFPAPTPSATGNVTPSLLASPSSFGTATARASGVATPSLLVSNSTFFTPTIITSGPGTALAPLLLSPSTFNVPSISTTGRATAVLLSSVSTFFTPTISIGITATAPLLLSPSTFGTPTAKANGNATPALLISISAFGIPIAITAGATHPNFIGGKTLSLYDDSPNVEDIGRQVAPAVVRWSHGTILTR